MVRRRIGGALGVLVAILAGILATTVPVRDFEARTTLPVLMALRGPLASPPRALVIVIGQSDLAALSFHATDLRAAAPGLATCIGRSAEPSFRTLASVEQLPRWVHACALGILGRAGVRIVAMDIVFAQQRPAEENAALAAALAGFDRSVILESVQPDPGGPGAIMRLLPDPAFRGVAQTAFFSVGRKAGLLAWLGRHPTAPEVSALPEVVARLIAAGPLPDAGEEVPFVVYGPPGTVPTLRLLDLFAPGGPVFPADIAQRAVFLGADGAIDGFPKDAARGASIWPGVELAATAVLNRLEGRQLRRLPAWGEGLAAVVAALLFRFLGCIPRGRMALPAIGAAAVAWTVLAAAGFLEGGLLLPLAVPVLVLAPLHALWSQLRRLAMLRGLLHRLLPGSVADRLEAGPGADDALDSVETATVLIADMAGSTRLGSSLSPPAFRALLERYFEIIEGAVERHGGFVVKFTGDGALALFPGSTTRPDHAARALTAAVAIAKELAAENRKRPGELPVRVRIGVNSGEIASGMISTGTRTQYDVFSDVVNVTSRLEALGKELFPDEIAVILTSGETQAASGKAATGFAYCGRRRLRDRPGEMDVFRVLVPET